MAIHTKPQNLKNAAAVIKSGKQFARVLQSDKNGRYQSWEHCYSVFAKYKGKKLLEDDLDFLCLHLSFYLASWGMYRGSSFLLQKDYRVHGTAIEEIMKDDYMSLWAIECKNYICDSDNLQKLFSLSNKLEEIYSGIRRDVCKRSRREVPVQAITDTLITKILMGTLGCVPAYDRYFNDGVKKCGVASARFNPESIQSISDYYDKNSVDFENWRKDISSKGIKYPQMKILDMCFWQIGYDLSASNKKQLTE
jgi:hypothetical protein